MTYTAEEQAEAAEACYDIIRFLEGGARLCDGQSPDEASTDDMRLIGCLDEKMRAVAAQARERLEVGDPVVEVIGVLIEFVQTLEWAASTDRPMEALAAY